MVKTKNEQFSRGIERLGQPVLPLVRILQLLYLTGPFERIAPILEELNEPVEMETAVYHDPKALLLRYLPTLQLFEHLKHPGPVDFLVYNEDREQLDSFESIELMACQEILKQELEEINSLLCGPCGCALCCVGPTGGMAQDFFEIPLTATEISQFQIPRFDTAASRQTDPYHEPPFRVGGKPFFSAPLALYHWRHNWSLILPKKSSCPNLDPASGGCTIYPNRPEVCRRPQIFPYALERAPELDTEGRTAYCVRRKLLAVWDCPYVQELQGEIGLYAELCGLEPIFKRNKG
ncbi:YkgJ family cysteine cluster protein [Thiovibrio sp. JS02]